MPNVLLDIKGKCQLRQNRNFLQKNLCAERLHVLTINLTIYFNTLQIWLKWCERSMLSVPLTSTATYGLYLILKHSHFHDPWTIITALNLRAVQLMFPRDMLYDSLKINYLQFPTLSHDFINWRYSNGFCSIWRHPGPTNCSPLKRLCFSLRCWALAILTALEFVHGNVFQRVLVASDSLSVLNCLRFSDPTGSHVIIIYQI